MSFQFQTNVSKRGLFRALKLTFSSFWRNTFVFSFHCFQSQAWTTPKKMVSAWKKTFFCRLETFVPIRKTNLSPVERFVSIPKQTPDCIPTATRVALHRSCQKKRISGVMLEVRGYVCFPWTKMTIPCVFDLVTYPFKVA